MGRAMLILTTLIFVVLGIIQVNTLEKREQVTETNVEAYQKVQANNLGLTGFEFAMRKFKQNSSWRGPTSMSISGQEVTFEAEDYTTNPDLTYDQLLVKVYTNIGDDKENVARGLVRRSGVIPPIYSSLGFYSDSLNFSADGKSFEINGNDENLDGTEGQASSLYGIKTTNQDAYNSVYNELEDAGPDQTENVTGAGSTPSMSVDKNMKTGEIDELAVKYEDNADIVITDGDHGEVTLGTDDDPKIAVVEDGVNAKFSGSKSSGSGVLLLKEGATLEISGDFTYHGIILNRGKLTQATGNVKVIGGFIFGSNSSSYQSIDLSGNITIQYSTEALRIVEKSLDDKLQYEYRVLSFYQ